MTFQGNYNQPVGLLQVEDEVQVQFAQLYILDSSMETTVRVANMNMPSNISLTDNNTSTSY